MANDNGNLRMKKVVDNQTIAAATTYTSRPIDVNKQKYLGSMTAHVKVTGTGVILFPRLKF